MERAEKRSAAGGRLANVSAALLLGGPSTKFGDDKADALLAGSSLADRAATLLSTLFEDVLLVGGPDRPGLPGRPIADSAGPQCPLRGLVTALEAARESRVLVLTIDLPLLPPDLLLALTAWPEAPVVAPRRDGRIEGLCAIYSRDEVLPIARQRMQAGQIVVQDLISSLAGSFIEGDDLRALDPEDQAFLRVDTPADLERVASLGRR